MREGTLACFVFNTVVELLNKEIKKKKVGEF